MKHSLRILYLTFVVAAASTCWAQNGDYSAYYSFTSTVNSDGSSSVTATAEMTGIDDVSDWVQGQYRPVCTVRPKIQVTGDADWVGGTRVALGHAVDQVRTGLPISVPVDGSAVDLQFGFEVDANCSGAPNQTYYQYPTIANLYTWSAMDPSFWFLAGFAPAQTGPPYWLQYCPSAEICPVAYGVASIRNFVDFAFFSDIYISAAHTWLKMKPGTETNCRLILGDVWCDYGTQTWCTPETTPPDYNPSGVQLVLHAIPNPAYYWYTSALCYRYGKSAPRTCVGAALEGIPGADNLPRVACTKTP